MSDSTTHWVAALILWWHPSIWRPPRLFVAHAVTLLCAGLLLALAGCNAPRTSTRVAETAQGGRPKPVVHLPQQAPPTREQPSMAAELTGQLVLGDACLRLNSQHPEASYLVIWPHGYTVYANAEKIEIRDPSGTIVARVGDIVQMSGGEVNHEHLLLAIGSGQTEEPWLSECPGPYWILGSVVSAIR